jgi:hypothetical protein
MKCVMVFDDEPPKTTLGETSSGYLPPLLNFGQFILTILSPYPPVAKRSLSPLEIPTTC